MVGVVALVLWSRTRSLSDEPGPGVSVASVEEGNIVNPVSIESPLSSVKLGEDRTAADQGMQAKAAEGTSRVRQRSNGLAALPSEAEVGTSFLNLWGPIQEASGAAIREAFFGQDDCALKGLDGLDSLAVARPTCSASMTLPR